MSWKDILNKGDDRGLSPDELDNWIDEATRDDDDWDCKACGENTSKEEYQRYDGFCEECNRDAKEGY